MCDRAKCTCEGKLKAIVSNMVESYIIDHHDKVMSYSALKRAIECQAGVPYEELLELGITAYEDLRKEYGDVSI